MKSKTYFLIISLFILLSEALTNNAHACVDSWHSPRGYFMFRISGTYDYMLGEMSQNNDPEHLENCILWQKQTGSGVSLDDIYDVVYRYSLNDILAIRNGSNKTLNSFSKWIVEKNDTEIADFLILAKTCEQIRLHQNSAWYYPTKLDSITLTLNDVVEQAKSHTNSRLRDRYALQAVRAMFALKQYEECINFYDNTYNRMSAGLIRDMMQSYIAGANMRIGNFEQAITHFAKIGDISSLRYCYKKEGKEINDNQLINLVHTHCPDARQLILFVENIIRKAEVGYYDDSVMGDLRDLSLRIASQGRVRDRAMWYYTAAFITDMLGKPTAASVILRKAESARGSDIVKESVKVMRIYLDAKNSNYDLAYEQRLFGQLKWLDKKIVDNITDGVATTTKESYGYYIQKSESYYYWNDMMRRIILGELCPRMVERGKYTRAIQFASMATYRLFNAINYSARSADWNHIDYSSHLFALIDSLGVDKLISYKKSLGKQGSSFDKFLNERGYTDEAFLNDIIGTKCLQQMRYADAETYLASVPAAFQYTLNTYKDGCMWRDPFSDTSVAIDDNNDYKYRFASRMHHLEQAISLTTDPNRRSQLMLHFVTGIRNSFDGCWALTQYYKGSMWGNVDTNNRLARQSKEQANARVKTLTTEALRSFTDRELAARAYKNCYYFLTVIERFPETRAAQEVRGACDNYSSYFTLLK